MQLGDASKDLLDESRDHFRDLQGFSLKKKVRSINSSRNGLRFNSQNLFQTRRRNQTILRGPQVKYGYSDLSQFCQRVTVKNGAKTG
jgi:hypothetical protein